MKTYILTASILASIVCSCLAQKTDVDGGVSEEVKSSFSDKEKSYRQSPEFLLRAFSFAQQELTSTGKSINDAASETEKKELASKFNSMLARSQIYQAQLKIILEKYIAPGIPADILPGIQDATKVRLPAPIDLGITAPVGKGKETPPD